MNADGWVLVVLVGFTVGWMTAVWVDRLLPPAKV